jgi:hypothetical protein
MKTKSSSSPFRFLALLCAVLLVAFFYCLATTPAHAFTPDAALLAQITADAVPADVAAPVAITAEAAAPLTWQQSLIAVITPLLIAGIKLLVPKIPRVWLPILAPLLGVLLEWIAHLATGATLNVWAGVALGAAGVGLREAVTQIHKALPPAAS